MERGWYSLIQSRQKTRTPCEVKAEIGGLPTISLPRCARCLGPHADLIVERLHNPSDEWTHWAMCPSTLQPILVRYVEITDNAQNEG